MTDADGAAGTAGSEGPVDKSRKVYRSGVAMGGPGRACAHPIIGCAQPFLF